MLKYIYEIMTNDDQISYDVYSKITDGIFSILLGLSFKEFVYLLSPLQLCFKFAMLFFSYVTVIFSRIGYHKSIKSKPYKGSNRFWADIMILYMYYILVFSPGKISEDYNIMSLLISVFGIFGGYVLWDFIKTREYDIKYGPRQYITLLGMVLSFFTLILYNNPCLQYGTMFLDAPVTDWLFLIFDFLIFIMFWFVGKKV